MNGLHYLANLSVRLPLALFAGAAFGFSLLVFVLSMWWLRKQRRVHHEQQMVLSHSLQSLMSVERAWGSVFLISASVARREHIEEQLGAAVTAPSDAISVLVEHGSRVLGEPCWTALSSTALTSWTQQTLDQLSRLPLSAADALVKNQDLYAVVLAGPGAPSAFSGPTALAELCEPATEFGVVRCVKPFSSRGSAAPLAAPAIVVSMMGLVALLGFGALVTVGHALERRCVSSTPIEQPVTQQNPPNMGSPMAVPTVEPKPAPLVLPPSDLAAANQKPTRGTTASSPHQSGDGAPGRRGEDPTGAGVGTGPGTKAAPKPAGL